MIISIDGPAGSGKSTAAEILSKKLGFVHFNSGSLFRAVAVFIRESGCDTAALTSESAIPKLNFKVAFKGEQMQVFVNKLDCTPHLRDNEISILSAKISVNKFVRTQIDDFQRKFAKTHDIVMDGRDIGSHVFPNAEFKFYLDCSLKERAKRRQKEEKAKGNKLLLRDIKAQIAERDELDKAKKYAPLVVPNGAIVIDSTALTIEQVVGKMLEIINEKSA